MCAEERNSVSNEHRHSSDNETLNDASAQEPLNRDASIYVEMANTTMWLRVIIAIRDYSRVTDCVAKNHNLMGKVQSEALRLLLDFARPMKEAFK